VVCSSILKNSNSTSSWCVFVEFIVASMSDRRYLLGDGLKLE
jgi:hypothetical protein